MVCQDEALARVQGSQGWRKMTQNAGMDALGGHNCMNKKSRQGPGSQGSFIEGTAEFGLISELKQHRRRLQSIFGTHVSVNREMRSALARLSKISFVGMNCVTTRSSSSNLRTGCIMMSDRKEPSALLRAGGCHSKVKVTQPVAGLPRISSFRLFQTFEIANGPRLVTEGEDMVLIAGLRLCYTCGLYRRDLLQSEISRQLTYADLQGVIHVNLKV